MAKAQPTAKTLAECRKRGWPAYVCEKWIPRVNIRKDAFGFGDVLVMDGLPGSLLIQATSEKGGVAKRVRKITDDCTEHARAWLEAGNRIECWGWGQKVHRNRDGSKSKVKRWTLRIVPVTLSDFEDISLLNSTMTVRLT